MVMYSRILVAVSVVAAITYLRTDTSSLFHLALQAFFGLGIVSLFIQCVDHSWLCILKRWRKVETTEELNYEEIRTRQDRERERTQKEHSEKASSYRERILKPREDAKKKQKEEEYYKFMGPGAWKGQGQTLGGESHEDGETSQDAAKHRSVPENINEDVLQAARKEIAQERKIKKKIQLPDEPPEGADNSILVVLRTPLGQIQQRRFLDTETVQTILDYMTTLGFHQRAYTVCTSYPRECLTQQREKTLTDLGFRRKVTLNIEEMDLE